MTSHRALLLTVEVGSTMTKVNGFVRCSEKGLRHVAQGFSPTTVQQGDVSVGVDTAMRAAHEASGLSFEGAEIFVNSSAAGGLRVSVHGLTLNMTARAAKEASLGAGAIIKKLTAGRIFEHDLEELRELAPNLIILAGGVDFGDTHTVMANADILMQAQLSVPVIYAGNAALQKPIAKLADRFGVELWRAENVFPAVDELNVVPLRRLIHDAFARHIIHAPGMSRIAEYTSLPVLPTPGAVLLATQAFAENFGDALVVDVGGATTDVHSVTDGSPEYTAHMLEPEPREKRTVEGDLGVYVNASHVLDLDSSGEWQRRAQLLRVLPHSAEEKDLTRWLCETAVVHAVKRHAGTISEVFTPSGKRSIVRGKDLTAVRYVVGTGGALTRVEGGETILARICQGPGTHLLPAPNARVLLDSDYLFSALGTIAQRYPHDVSAALGHLFGV